MKDHDSFSDFKQYLDKIKDTREDKCWFCLKTPDKLREEYLEYMKRPSKKFQQIELEDIRMLTYQLKKPICASCYFTIKKNSLLIKEILDKTMEDVWSL